MVSIQELKEKYRTEEPRKTVISFAVSQETKAKISLMADREHRTLSSMCHHIIAKAVEEYYEEGQDEDDKKQSPISIRYN